MKINRFSWRRVKMKLFFERLDFPGSTSQSVKPFLRVR